MPGVKRVPGVGGQVLGGENSMAIRSFRDLRVWQVGMELVDQVYRSTNKFRLFSKPCGLPGG